MSVVGTKRRLAAAVAGLVLTAALVEAQPAAKPNPAPAARSTDLSAMLEAAAQRVHPAVVRIFATGYVAGEGLLPATADLVATARSPGSGVLVDPAGYIVTNAHVVRGASRVAGRSGGRAARHVDPALGGASVRRAAGRPRCRDRSRRDQDRRAGPAGADLRRFRRDPHRTDRAGGRQPARLRELGLARRRQRGGAAARARDPDGLSADRRRRSTRAAAAVRSSICRAAGRHQHARSPPRSGGSQGIGFAAPSNIVRTVYDQIKATGKVRRGDIGVRAQTIGPALATG